MMMAAAAAVVLRAVAVVRAAGAALAPVPVIAVDVRVVAEGPGEKGVHRGIRVACNAAVKQHADVLQRCAGAAADAAADEGVHAQKREKVRQRFVPLALRGDDKAVCDPAVFDVVELEVFRVAEVLEHLAGFFFISDRDPHGRYLAFRFFYLLHLSQFTLFVKRPLSRDVARGGPARRGRAPGPKSLKAPWDYGNINTMEILYLDNSIAVCVKPAGALSTDEPGGAPDLLRAALGDPAAPVFTVHRLDRVVGGLLLLARTREAASALGRQVMDGRFRKAYLAVVHGVPEASEGTFTDLLRRDRRECRTYVADAPGKDAREAISDYTLLQSAEGMSLLRITLRTGRTHQIRAQFAAHGLPLAGDRKYGTLTDGDTPIALWSHRLAFFHPIGGAPMDFTLPPPGERPWTDFALSASRTEGAGKD